MIKDKQSESNNEISEEKNLATAKSSVLVKSDFFFEKEIIKGYDFNKGIDYSLILDSYYTTGFQATNLGIAMRIINKMISWRLSDEAVEIDEDENLINVEVRKQVRCKIFLGYTSNLVSSGIRDIIRYLCQHKMIDCIVTTAGGVEEDFIKCLLPTYKGEFSLKGELLREKGLNRIGNLLVPNENYCKFEDWVTPLLENMKKDQFEKGTNWTPSKVIDYLGSQINDESSIYYWCWKNKIQVFCPALSDGSLGDMMFFNNFSDYKERFKLDIIEDICLLNKYALKAKKTGMIILGGGIIKHHINNANLMRNGADYAVYINTAQEYDGSDAGAKPDEAVSWGKIRVDSESVKVHAEVTLVFPLIVAKTFALRKDEFSDKN